MSFISLSPRRTRFDAADKVLISCVFVVTPSKALKSGSPGSPEKRKSDEETIHGMSFVDSNIRESQEVLFLFD